MTKYIAIDAAIPTELFKLILYYLSILIFMCRLPFSIVTSVHFMRFPVSYTHLRAHET